uniref:Uncharacterized protein n=1 Tax=Plectus sambesii TaxID=2011161 RepID=A0A914UNJ3_9BILA
MDEKVSHLTPLFAFIVVGRFLAFAGVFFSIVNRRVVAVALVGGAVVQFALLARVQNRLQPNKSEHSTEQILSASQQLTEYICTYTAFHRISSFLHYIW